MEMQTFISPFTDMSFKRLFGQGCVLSVPACGKADEEGARLELSPEKCHMYLPDRFPVARTGRS